jgi:sugar phosphate isomerase/epimerase
LRDRELDELKVLARQRNIFLEVGTRGFDQDELCAYIEIAKRFDSPILRFVPWNGGEAQSRLSIDGLMQFLQSLLPACQEYGITLALENHFDIPEDDLARIVLRMNHPNLGICLDTTNSTGLLQHPLKTVETLAPYAVSLHLKDFFVTKNGPKGYTITGCPLGTGWLDLPAVIRLVEEQPRRMNVLLELWVAPADTPEEMVRKEQDWIEQSIAYAKGLLSPRIKRNPNNSAELEGDKGGKEQFCVRNRDRAGLQTTAAGYFGAA